MTQLRRLCGIVEGTLYHRIPGTRSDSEIRCGLRPELGVKTMYVIEYFIQKSIEVVVCESEASFELSGSRGGHW